MSYSERYRIEFNNKYNVNSVISIEELDYSGTVTELNAGSSNPVLRKDVDGHFMGTSLTFYVEAEDVDGMPQFYTENPRKFKVKYYRDNTLVFVGFLVPEQYSDPYIYPPFDIELEAMDGIGLLKNIDFDLFGINKEIDIIDHILKKTGFEFDIAIAVNIQHELQSNSRPALEYTSINVNQFYSSDGEAPACYDVLDKILGSYGNEIYLSRIGEKWIIFRKVDMFGNYFVYRDATYISTANLMSIVDYNNTSFFVVNSFSRSLDKRLHNVFLSTDLGRVNSILPDDLFKKVLHSGSGVYAKYICENWNTVGDASQSDVSRAYTDADADGVSCYFPENTDNYSNYLSYHFTKELSQTNDDWKLSFVLKIIDAGYYTTRDIAVPFDVVFHGNNIGTRYLTENGWSSTQEPLKATLHLVSIGRINTVLPEQSIEVIIDSLPDDGTIEFRFYRNQDSYTNYGFAINVKDMTFGPNVDTSDIPAFTNCDLTIMDPPINTESIEGIIGSAPDYPNKDVFYKKVKFDVSGETAIVGWKQSNDTEYSSLIEILTREIASNNRGPIQILSGTLNGSQLNLFTAFKDKTTANEPIFFLYSGEWDLYEDEISGTWKEYFDFQEQSFQYILSENFSSDNSDPITSSTVGGGSGSAISAISWDSINGKPSTFPPEPHGHSIEEISIFSGKFYMNENGDFVFNTNIYVYGDVIQEGSTYETHAEQVFTKNDFITLREGALSGLGSDISGFKILKADGTNNLILGAGSDAIGRIGWENGILQAIATREDNPTSNGIAHWDSTLNMFVAKAKAADADKLDGLESSQFLRSDVDDTMNGNLTVDNLVIPTGGKITINISDSYSYNNESIAWYGMTIAITNGIYREAHLSGYGGVRLKTDSGLLHLTKVGKVGINTDTPTEALDVNGNGLFSGNIKATGEGIFGSHLESIDTFVSGFAGVGSGWKLDATDNHLTVDNLTVRNSMDVYELVINKIRATNGSLWVSDALKISATQLVDAGARYRLFFDNDNSNKTAPFSQYDIIKAQNFDGRNIKVFVGRIDRFDSGVPVVYPLEGTPWKGMEIVRIGNSQYTNRQGAIYLTSSDNGAPYIDVLDGVDSHITTKPRNIRYIRDWLNGSTSNTGNHWVEIQAYKSGVNVALNKDIIRSDGVRVAGTTVTDGNTASNPYFLDGVGTLAKITVDLGSVQTIDSIKVWHYYSDSRTYHNTKTEVSEDGVNWYTIFDSSVDGEYTETSAGKEHILGVGKNKMRIGKLSGIANQSGYGIWGSRNGNDTDFVISSDGYAKIAGWNFNNYAIWKDNQFDGTVNIIMNTAASESPDGANRGRAGFTVYKDGFDEGFKIARMGRIPEKDKTNSWNSSTDKWGFQLGNFVNGNFKDIFRADEDGAFIAGVNFNDSRLWTNNWELNKDGSANFANGKINFLADGSAKIANINFDNSRLWTNNWELKADGTATFTKGNIAGFTIESDRLYSSNVEIINSQIKLKNDSFNTGNLTFEDFSGNQIGTISGRNGIAIESYSADITLASGNNINIDAVNTIINGTTKVDSLILNPYINNYISTYSENPTQVNTKLYSSALVRNVNGNGYIRLTDGVDGQLFVVVATDDSRPVYVSNVIPSGDWYQVSGGGVLVLMWISNLYNATTGGWFRVSVIDNNW